MPTNDCVIIGAGGHAKVVLDAYLRRYPDAKVELRDDALEKSGADVPSFMTGISADRERSELINTASRTDRIMAEC